MAAKSDAKAKRICLIGVTGDGKSSLANVLLGYAPNDHKRGFGTSAGAKSCSSQASIKTGFWLGDKSKPVKIIDTPGHGDSEGRDESLRMKIVKTIKDEKVLDVFIWVKNSESPRVTAQDKELIQIFADTFGAPFFHNVAVVFTRWNFSASVEKRRKVSGARLSTVKKQLFDSIVGPDYAGMRTIPMFAIDALYDEEEMNEKKEFVGNVAGLWDIVEQFSGLPVEDVQFVQSKVAKMTDELKHMKEVTEEAQKKHMEEVVALKHEMIRRADEGAKVQKELLKKMADNEEANKGLMDINNRAERRKMSNPWNPIRDHIDEHRPAGISQVYDDIYATGKAVGEIVDGLIRMKEKDSPGEAAVWKAARSFAESHPLLSIFQDTRKKNK